MKISNNTFPSFVHQTMAQKTEGAKNVPEHAATACLSRAADVYISQAGKELSAAARLRADQETNAESQLHEIRSHKEQVASDKQRIAEIDDTLNDEDNRLTDSDRETLLKERDELSKRSKTPEDQLHETYQQIRALQKKQENEALTGGDAALIDQQIGSLASSVQKQQDALKKQGKDEELLSQQAVQERVEQDAKTKETLAKQEEAPSATPSVQESLLQSTMAAVSKNVTDDNH